MCKYFKIETDVAQNLIDDFFFFFLILTVRGILSEKKYEYVISEKRKGLEAELNKRVEGATSSSSTTGSF